MKTRLLSGITALVACCVMMVGCEKGGGHDDDDGGGNQSANLSGTWSGTGYVQGIAAPTHMTLSQDGNSVSGQWDGYPVSGTFDGTTLALYGEWSQDGIHFILSGQGAYDGANIVNMNAILTGTKGGKRVKVALNVPKLTRSGHFALDGAGIVKTLCDTVSSSLK